ncbi:MAG: acyltransferase family protein [Desulforhopalus sp.]
MQAPYPSKTQYRADIDGIRSLAVLSVFFFHLQPELLPGGFLGVDVFFVISGYLITTIIMRENTLGSFSFIHFYTRRVKRIFPALFVVLLLSAVIATLLLQPATYGNFMTSARFASAQLANFFFAREVGYFNEGFSAQPLLHTWSLGVEEQFYLFWPLLIYFCFWLVDSTASRKSTTLEQTTEVSSPVGTGTGAMWFSLPRFTRINRKIAGVMLLLSLASFTVCSILAEQNHNLAFYMFYTRALEFCIGGLISLHILPAPRRNTPNTLLGALGLFMLCYSFMFVKEEYLGLSFLQFGVLLPCVGTALIIHAGRERGFINRVLATKVPVSIGRISYSLYLYHWPVIIFWKFFSDSNELTTTASVAIIAVSFLLAILSYRFVEQPARNSTMVDRQTLVLAGTVILVCVLSFKYLENFETASWRITGYVDQASPPLPSYSPGCQKELKDGLPYYRCNANGEDASPVVAIVGDSHSPHYLYATTVWAEQNGYDVKLDSLAACPVLLGDINIKSVYGKEHEADCRRRISLFKSEIIDDPLVKIVLLAHRFDLFHTGLGYANRRKPMVSFADKEGRKIKDHTAYYRARLTATVEAVRAKGKDIIILKQVPIFTGATDCDWEPRLKKLFNKGRVCDYNPAFLSKWQQPSIDFIDDFAASHNVPVFDPVPFFDKPLHDGINLYHDSDHLNEYGKHFLMPYFVKAMDDFTAEKHDTQSMAGNAVVP